MAERRRLREPQGPRVAVLGATVAGLTAAQELARRGFVVRVIRDPRVAVGGCWASRWTLRRGVRPFRSGGRPLPRAAALPADASSEPLPRSFVHLLDTLRVLPARARGKTLADELVELPWRPLRRYEQPWIVFPAAVFSGVEQVIDEVKAFEQQGYAHQDGHTFFARVLRFAASSAARRAIDCEGVTMLDYVSGANAARDAPNCEYSPAFAADLAGVSDLLFGVAPDTTDARTALGWYLRWTAGPNATVGFIPDRMSPCRRFSGPTAERWFDPWLDELYSLGVKVEAGRIDGLRASIRRGTSSSLGVTARLSGCAAATRAFVSRADYLVVAVDAHEAARVTARLPPVGVPGQLRSGDSKVATVGAEPPRWRGVGGVQLYLPEPLELAGPLSVIGSPWRLTIRQQHVFEAGAPQARRDGFGSVLHVLIAGWDNRSERGIVPGDCDGRRLAHEVWTQIEESGVLASNTPKRRRARPRRPPLWFSLDAEIGIDGKGHVRPGPARLACAVDDWNRRPGPEPEARAGDGDRDDALWRSGEGGSWVHWGRLVFAGEYLKTHTRLPNVEGACESGRHAANAVILHVSRRRRAPGRGSARGAAPRGAPPLAPTWNHERLEGLDLEWLRELDAWCVRERLPHPFEIAGIDAWVSLVSWFSVLSPAGPGVLRAIIEKLRAAAKPGRAAGGASPSLSDPDARATTYQEAVLEVLRRIRDSLEARANGDQVR
jgi:hypothetical protein